MEFTLWSNNLAITILSKGAEISSILFNEVEYIWQAKPDVWPRHAPVLFPIVGKLKNNSFHYHSNSYTLSQHGFARDKEFRMIKQTDNEIVFELVNDKDTEKAFPFQFKFLVTYKIENDTIECNYQVSNPSSSGELLFSIGAHPGFRVPLMASDKFTDYSIYLDPKRTYAVTELADGLLTENKKELTLTNGEIKITESLFDKDALVFEDSQIDSVILRSIISGKGIEMNCKNWPYFGIWSKKGCKEFVCLEPWYGIADSLIGNGDLKNKKGIIQLKAGQKFECVFTMRFF